MTAEQWAIIGAFVFLLTWTIVSAATGRKTISRTLWDWSLKWNSIPLLAGILIGHWFVPGPSWAIHNLGATLIPLSISCLLDVIHNKYQRLFRNRLFFFTVGLATGALLWSQGTY
jgi:hypothetical protein